MKRLLQVLTLGAAALVFTATGSGIATADQGRGGGQGGVYQGSRPDEPYLKPYKGYKNYGQYRRDRNRNYDNNRKRHHYGDREHWRHRYADKERRRHRYGDRQWRHDYREHRRHDHYVRRDRHRHYGHRHYYGVWPYVGLHFYPSTVYPAPIEVAPPAYPAQPPAYPVQPAVVEQQVVDAGPPSTCLMTREYQTEIVVGGELVPAYGQACLQPDGSWYRGPAVPESY